MEVVEEEAHHILLDTQTKNYIWNWFISKAIDLCNDTHNEENLEFLVGDSADIPFDNDSFDVVINVESSHCYPSIPKFVNEVSRVLKKGGKFLYCDFVINSSIDEHLNKLKSDYLLYNNYTDITENIISFWINDRSKNKSNEGCEV